MVKPVVPPSPQLDFLRFDPESRPSGGRQDLAPLMLAGEAAKARQELRMAFQRQALTRRQRRQAALAWALNPERHGFRSRDLFDAAVDPHLPPCRMPVEDQ